MRAYITSYGYFWPNSSALWLIFWPYGFLFSRPSGFGLTYHFDFYIVHKYYKFFTAYEIKRAGPLDQIQRTELLENQMTE